MTTESHDTVHDPHAAHLHAVGAHHGDAHPPAEEDRVPSGRIIAVGAAALIVFTLGSVAAGVGMVAMRKTVNPEGDHAPPAEAGKPKIGMIEQRLFEHSNMGVAWREGQQRRLGSFGWVDKQKGVAHIPIDQAMEMVEKGAHP
jgi:hypothetical protein